MTLLDAVRKVIAALVAASEERKSLQDEAVDFQSELDQAARRLDRLQYREYKLPSYQVLKKFLQGPSCNAELDTLNAELAARNRFKKATGTILKAAFNWAPTEASFNRLQAR